MASKKNDLKTQLSNDSVLDFLNQIEHPQKKADAWVLLEIMQELSGDSATLWGSNMIGFGSYHYVYASGREGDWFRLGFSPRKQNLTLYIMSGFASYDTLLAKLGKHKIGKSCLYVNKLADVDTAVLRGLISASLAYMAEKYPENAK